MWKTRFTNDVLTKIDGGYKIVGLWRNHDEEEGIPCRNCYFYGGTVCGVGQFCMNCAGDESIDYTLISYADLKMQRPESVALRRTVSLMDVFNSHEDFKRWSIIEKIRIDHYLPTLNKKELHKVLLKWEIKKTAKIIN
jgi:hypothetical protein